MNINLKYLAFGILISSILHAADNIQDFELINTSRLKTHKPPSFVERKSVFNSEENYKKLTSAYDKARTGNAYNKSIQAVYNFVEQHPEDKHSVDLLEHVAIFFPTWEADVNIPLFRKIAEIPSHPKAYEAYMTLYFYGKKKDKEFATWNFLIIAKDKTHSRQKCAAEFLNAMIEDWDNS